MGKKKVLDPGGKVREDFDEVFSTELRAKGWMGMEKVIPGGRTDSTKSYGGKKPLRWWCSSMTFKVLFFKKKKILFIYWMGNTQVKQNSKGKGQGMKVSLSFCSCLPETVTVTGFLTLLEVLDAATNIPFSYLHKVVVPYTLVIQHHALFS